MNSEVHFQGGGGREFLVARFVICFERGHFNRACNRRHALLNPRINFWFNRKDKIVHCLIVSAVPREIDPQRAESFPHPRQGEADCGSRSKTKERICLAVAGRRPPSRSCASRKAFIVQTPSVGVCSLRRDAGPASATAGPTSERGLAARLTICGRAAWPSTGDMTSASCKRPLQTASARAAAAFLSMHRASQTPSTFMIFLRPTGYRWLRDQVICRV